ncbi:hypothetical protein FLAPJACK_181 [Bacillus phage Flapjack]|uniref:Uncharacterized protein n=1 Tax=Bacillus phage Flapjack TaxID=1983465 RepID=A0A1X9SG29_9CAUD|nr:hypothetical protein FLAPJACK_181 [Bacillus phage Flapjack]
MTSITITYDFNNDADINETLEVLVALGELNYCVESRPSKGSLQLKKVHQEVVSMDLLDRIAAAEQKITDDSILLTKTEVEFEGLTKSPAAKELEFPDKPILSRPAPRVFCIGGEYIVAYSQYDAVNFLVKRDRLPHKDIDAKFSHESTIDQSSALIPSYMVKGKFKEELTLDFPSGVRAEWVDGDCYYDLMFDYVLNLIDFMEPFTLASIENIRDEIKVVYKNTLPGLIEEYLSAKGE